jgi:hypothetical protein
MGRKWHITPFVVQPKPLAISLIVGLYPCVSM